MSEKITSLATLQPAVITADFDSMREKLDEKLDIYKGFDTQALASQTSAELRAERADINSIINDLEDARKAIKRAYNAPLAEFESKCKELLEPARELSAHFKEAIDEQANQFKQERYNELKTVFEESAGALVGIVDFEVFLEKDWFKKSYSFEKAVSQILDKVGQLASDWENLKKLGLTYQSDAELVLFATLDLGQAIEADELKRKEVESLKKLENVVAENKGKSESVQEWTVVLTCTKAELDRVVGFCKENNIKGLIKGGN